LWSKYVVATIRKLKSGLWQSQIRLAGFAPRTASFPTKRKALEWSQREETNLKQGLANPSVVDVRQLRGVTLRDLVLKWKAAKRPRSYDAAVNSILADPLADVCVSSISKESVIEWKNRKLMSIKSSSVARYVRVPRGAWEYGQDVLSLPLSKNPFLRIGIKESKRRRHRRLSKGEYPLLISALGKVSSNTAVGEDLRAIIDFALETGMRRGEIAGMRLSHLREVNGKQFLWIPETKTDRPRLIPLTKKALEIITSRANGAYDSAVFGVSGRWITYYFTRLCARAQVSDLHFHDLRHEALSRLNEKGLSAFDIKLISGHKTTENLDVYIQSDLDRVAALVAA
jgi:integrase